MNEELKEFEARLNNLRKQDLFDLEADDLTSIKILLNLVEPHLELIPEDTEEWRAFRHLKKKFPQGQKDS